MLTKIRMLRAWPPKPEDGDTRYSKGAVREVDAERAARLVAARAAELVTEAPPNDESEGSAPGAASGQGNATERKAKGGRS